ncbi:MAG TPA: alpha/beta fold hydrolase [Acidimicrobiia bacterium]|nr:alpha/beta fold hydrolase [Acidimicrobiia bacterium]
MALVLIPGFTQTAASWDPALAHLPPDLETVAVDVPTGLGFVETAVAISEKHGRAVYCGYSMGGRLCLHLALDRPDLVRGLVVLSASPGIADDAERAARRDADEKLAREIESDGVDAFLDRWLRQPLFATLPPDAAGLDARRAGNTVATLTHALRALGPGAQEPLWDRLGDLEPLFVPAAGVLDEKYVDIAFEMAARVGPDVHPVLIGGAGHAAHLENPEAVASLLRRVVHDVTS